MSEQLESTVPLGTIGAFLTAPRAEPSERSAALSKPRTRHSVSASAFLLLYVAVYLAIGFVGISLLGRVWATVFE